MAEGQALKRRGILAAAGAMVAGIAAKQAAQPVSATTQTLNYQDDPNGGVVTNYVGRIAVIAGAGGSATTQFKAADGVVFKVDAANSTGNVASIDGINSYGSGQYTGIVGFGGGYGNSNALGGSGVLGLGGGILGAGVVGIASGARNPGGQTFCGVYGTGVGIGATGVVGKSDGAYGVYGTSTGYAVVGDSSTAPINSGIAGVYGLGSGRGNFGVIGDSGSGTEGGTVGVQGQNAQYGVVGTVSNLPNSIAVYGNNQSTGANAIGVYGTSTKGTGVVGVTGTAFNYGVLGQALTANATAIAGACTGNGSSAFSGGTTNPNAYAGVFQGTVVVQGKLVVSDPSYKSGALQHPDGSTRLVYCVESPESWIEDVGTGTLTNGKATVTFDKDFTAVTHTDTYHVFLTPYDGACKGLGVTVRRADGFVVQELNGGTTSGAFSWKVMVKGKSSVKSERLGKFTMPTIPLPDPSKFKAPEMPVAAPLPRKP